MSKPISLRALTTILVQEGVCVRAFDAREYNKGINGKGNKHLFTDGYSMGDETYGKDSRVYLGTPSKERRAALESALERKGVALNRSYGSGGSTLEIRVTYFKGFHWNE